jgi:hypothetical protein
MQNTAVDSCINAAIGSCINTAMNSCNGFMLISLPIERYSRCYPRYEEQYSDVGGEPLYMLMPSMQASQSPMSQTPISQMPQTPISQAPLLRAPIFQTVAHSNLWTAIAASESVKINWEMTVATTDAISIQVTASVPGTTLILVCKCIGIIIVTIRNGSNFPRHSRQDSRFLPSKKVWDFDILRAR